MKLKASLMFGVLVLMLSVAGISPANAATAPFVNAPVAAAPILASESSSSFLCSLNQAVKVELPKTDSLIPPSKPATSLACGSCSDFVCQGFSINTVCGRTLRLVSPFTAITSAALALRMACSAAGAV